MKQAGWLDECVDGLPEVGSLEPVKPEHELVGVGHCFTWQGYSSLDGLMDDGSCTNIESSYLP